MGVNIPYTHGEDKPPSSQLITKTAVAFAYTGLLFLYDTIRIGDVNANPDLALAHFP